jgi:hypothetical protein
MGAAGVLAFVALALALGHGETARAQSVGGTLQFLAGAAIAGTPTVGQTLTASGASWLSPNPTLTLVRWEWWHCPNGANTVGCSVIGGANTPSYTLSAADVGAYVRDARYICYPTARCNGGAPDAQFLTPSAAKGPVATPTPVPTPTPTPIATPTPTPIPEPVFVATPTPTPVPTTGQVLHETAMRKIMRPFPTVRMRGRLTKVGARVTLLSVRAPKAAKVIVRCKGTCPAKTWAPPLRKKSLTRVRAFERSLRSGTVLSVSITRHGYVGKKTVFEIRRGRSPLRIDSCLAPGTTARRTTCPGG